MRNVLIVGGFALVSLFGSLASAQQIATVDLMSVAGSGCQKDDFAVAIASDNTAFTVSYYDYTAMAGLGTTILDHRKNCVLDIKVTVPNGFTFGIAEADMRGYTHLEANANALARVGYWFQGDPATGYTNHAIRSSTVSAPGTYLSGVLDDNWETTDQAAWGSIVWASCNEQRNLNVNTELRITSPEGDPSSLVTEDTTDASITTLFHLAFMPCP